MTSIITILALGVIIILAIVFLAIRYGKSQSHTEQAEEIIHDLQSDGKIDSKPNVDDPLDRM